MYGYKFPREDWTKVRKIRASSIKKAMIFIQDMYASGYTQEPYVQLVEGRSGEWRVVAEWRPGQRMWVDPLAAAGFSGYAVGSGFRVAR